MKTSRRMKEMMTRSALGLGAAVVRGVVLAAAFAGIANVAHATSYYWDCTSPIENAGFGTAGGTWGTDLRWSTSSAGTVTPGIQSPTTSDDLNFGSTSDGLVAGTVTVTGIQNAKSLTFEANSGAIVLSGGTITLPATSTITVNNTADTISSVIAGASGGITKSGTGTLTLSGKNTYSGGTTISGGTLKVANAAALGNVSNSLSITSGATLDVNAGSASAGLAWAYYATTPGSQATFTGTLARIQGVISAVMPTSIANATSLNGVPVAPATSSSAIGSGMIKITTGGTYTFQRTSQDEDAAIFVDGQAVVAGVPTSNPNPWTQAATSNSITLAAGLHSIAVPYYQGIGGYGLRIQWSGPDTGNILVDIATNSTGTIITPDLYIANLSGAGNLALTTGNLIAGYDNTSTTFSGAISGIGGVTKYGTGTLTLSGTNTFTRGVTISAGELKLGNAAALNSTAGSENAVAFGAATTETLTLNGNSVVIANLTGSATGAIVQNNLTGTATLTVGNSTNASGTYAGILQNGAAGTLALTKAGTGTLTLSGTNTYTGTTTVNGGSLLVNSPGSIASAATVNSGGTLGGSGTISNSVTVSGGTLSPGASAASAGTLTIQGNLSLASGGTATFDLAGSATVGGGVNDLIQLTGTARDLALNSNPVTINPLAPLAVGTPYTLITFTGTRSGSLGTVSGIGRQPATVSYDDTPGAGKVMVTFGAPAPAGLIWNSASSSVWDVSTTPNWSNTASSASDVFYQSDNVTFDDTPGVQKAITLNTTVTPSTVTVNSSANAFSLSGTGKISGSATLTKSGSSTCIISNVNDYAGTTTINSGTLELAGNSSIADASAIALNGGSVRFSGGGMRGGLISGAGNLVKAGTNTLTLSGNNSYDGVTTLAAGTLSLATLANGGVNSPIGAASIAASNLVFSGGALSYTGPSASSDRGFTLAYGTNIITVTDAAATLTLTGGCPTNTVFLEKAGAGTLVLDPGTGSYSLGSLAAYGGTLTLKSGTITTSKEEPITKYANSVGARYNGKLVVDGATLNAANGYRITIGAASSGYLDIRSGTVNVGWLILGHNGTVTSTQSGGSVNAAELFHYDGGTATHTMTGGVLTVRRIYNWTKTTGATFTLNLNGGTIVAAAGTANLIDHNSQTNLPALEVAVKLGSVGATIDTSLSSATNVLPMVDMPGQAGRLTKIGTGTLSLTATNTYSGVTVVSNGVLRLTHAQVLAATNEVRIATGAMINLDFNGTQTIRRLYINDELMTINTRYGPDNLPASLSGTSGYLFTTEGAPPKGTLISFF